jgi:hypothetical protein
MAQDSNGTLVQRQATPGGAFETIAELGDITPPGMSRNEFDASVQNFRIDRYVLGILRRGAMTVPLNFEPEDPTHDHTTGLYQALFDKSVDGYKVIYPDGTEWIFSGQVQNLQPGAPVDGKLALDATFRFSGLMIIDGVVIGE